MLEKKPSKLLDQVKEKIRFLHYSRETEKSYVHWIRRYILFDNNRHHKNMPGEEVTNL